MSKPELLMQSSVTSPTMIILSMIFDFLIGMDFLNFCQSDSTMLKRRLVDQAVETAKDLCRAGQFDSSLTLNTIRRCKEDPTWFA